LLIYKFESFELFKQMVMRMNREMTSFLMKAYLPQENQNQVKEVQAPKNTESKKWQTSRTDEVSMPTSAPGTAPNPEQQPERKAQPVRVEKTVGRNDPCPCGSGKKYKNCHGQASV
jgi:preprotein translocase subunit SecA